MTRPVKTTIRNKNFTNQQMEESKGCDHQNHKEQKMSAITEHRRVALMGNRTERFALTQKFQVQAKEVDQARFDRDSRVKNLDISANKAVRESFMATCRKRDQETMNKRVTAIKIA